MHSPGFIKIAEEAKKVTQEIDVATLKTWLAENKNFHLIDVREESEWQHGHILTAIHLSKGIIERDIEHRIADKDSKIVLYCGGGYRSALAAENLQRMGYTNVYSLDGGYKSWKANN